MISPENLTTNGRVDPIGVDDQPLLAWDADVDAESFRLEVQDATGSALWTAAIEGARVLRYAGPALASRTRYRWRVRSVDGTGPTSGWSVGVFETGLLVAADWQARWIGLATPPASHRFARPSPTRSRGSARASRWARRSRPRARSRR